MTSLASIAISGLNAAQTVLNVSAHNIANLDSAGFRRQQVVQTPQAGGGVSASVTRAGAQGPWLEADVVAQLQARNAFLANLAVFKTAHAITGALLDEMA